MSKLRIVTLGGKVHDHAGDDERLLELQQNFRSAVSAGSDVWTIYEDEEPLVSFVVRNIEYVIRLPD